MDLPNCNLRFLPGRKRIISTAGVSLRVSPKAGGIAYQFVIQPGLPESVVEPAVLQRSKVGL